MSRLAWLLALFLWSPLHAYEGGILKNHNHTTTPGDGGQINNFTHTGYDQINGSTSAAVSPSGDGRIIFDSISNNFKISQNGGAYVPISGVFVSTQTTIPTQSFSNTSDGPCLSGSTVTLTTNGGDIIVWADIAWTNGNSNLGAPQLLEANPLMDGNYISPYLANVGATSSFQIYGTGIQSNSFMFRQTGVSAASHTYCLSAATSGNVGRITDNDAGSSGGPGARVRWGMYELR